MRVLGIETSSRRGSLAIIDGSTVVGRALHLEPKAHAERMLPLLEKLFAETGVGKTTLDKIAVGVGPGSFVGLRVGIALAEGLGLGLHRPVVGVPSLSAMTRAAREIHQGPCLSLMDARRGEFFALIEAADGTNLMPAAAFAREALLQRIEIFGAKLTIVGEVAHELELEGSLLTGEDLDLPDARWVAELGVTSQADPAPLYVRGPGATLPKLPPSPFSL
jgi:tRNA threonylcarbamoyladenosine biosynthesis protein TsaB